MRVQLAAGRQRGQLLSALVPVAGVSKASAKKKGKPSLSLKPSAKFKPSLSLKPSAKNKP
jgi:hypothetical protein